MKTLETILIAAAATGLAAWLLRALSGSRGGGRDTLSGPLDAAPPPGTTRLEDAADGDEGPDDAWLDELEGAEPAAHEVLVVTSDGSVFIPHEADVRVLPLGEAQDAITSGVVTWEAVREALLAVRRPEGSGLPGVQLDAGDFTAGRVKRGAPSEDPWRLELLGRDGEFLLYIFETEEAARLALGLLERMHIIARPLDEDGQPVPASAEDFEEARRRFDETLEELANLPEVEEPGEPR